MDPKAFVLQSFNATARERVSSWLYFLNFIIGSHLQASSPFQCLCIFDSIYLIGRMTTRTQHHGHLCLLDGEFLGFLCNAFLLKELKIEVKVKIYKWPREKTEDHHHLYFMSFTPHLF